MKYVRTVMGLTASLVLSGVSYGSNNCKAMGELEERNQQANSQVVKIMGALASRYDLLPSKTDVPSNTAITVVPHSSIQVTVFNPVFKMYVPVGGTYSDKSVFEGDENNFRFTQNFTSPTRFFKIRLITDESGHKKLMFERSDISQKVDEEVYEVDLQPKVHLTVTEKESREAYSQFHRFLQELILNKKIVVLNERGLPTSMVAQFTFYTRSESAYLKVSKNREFHHIFNIGFKDEKGKVGTFEKLGGDATFTQIYQPTENGEQTIQIPAQMSFSFELQSDNSTLVTITESQYFRRTVVLKMVIKSF